MRRTLGVRRIKVNKCPESVCGLDGSKGIKIRGDGSRGYSVTE